MDPRTSRHISVSDTSPNQGQAAIQVQDFTIEPSPTIRRDHEIAIVMKLPDEEEFAVCLSTPKRNDRGMSSEHLFSAVTPW
jgi:hypothetical protein